MAIADLIPLAINLSMGLIVFALGLGARLDETMSVLREPGLLIRWILAMNVVMLVFAVAAALLFDLPPALRIALVALAVSPVPPVLPGKQVKAGGSHSHVIGLLVAASIVAIVLVPLSVAILGASLGFEARVPMRPIASVVLVSIVVPLAIGIALARFAPALAARIARPVSIFAIVLLVLACVPVLFKAVPAFWGMVGNGVILALVAFTLVGLAVGHFLGGPDPDDRTLLALATATRHPGVAIAVAGLTFPAERAVAIVVLFHLLIGAVASVPYVKWRTRLHAAALVRP